MNQNSKFSSTKQIIGEYNSSQQIGTQCPQVRTKFHQSLIQKQSPNGCKLVPNLHDCIRQQATAAPCPGQGQTRSPRQRQHTIVVAILPCCRPGPDTPVVGNGNEACRAHAPSLLWLFLVADQGPAGRCCCGSSTSTRSAVHHRHNINRERAASGMRAVTARAGGWRERRETMGGWRLELGLVEGEGQSRGEGETREAFHVVPPIWRYEHIPDLRGICRSRERVDSDSSTQPNTRMTPWCGTDPLRSTC